MPDIAFNSLINYTGKTIKLSDFKGKRILLDFWSTRCSSCIESFPKITSLQDEFKGKLQVIMVTYQPKELVQNFLVNGKRMQKLNMPLPMICNDTILRQFFPHRGDPYYAWIDENGSIKYLTSGSSDVNHNNINAFVNKLPVSITKKGEGEGESAKDNNISPFQPLFVNDNGGDGKQLLWYSSVSRYVKGFPTIQGIFHPDSSFIARPTYNPDRKMTNTKVGFAITNSIKGMFQVAYNDFTNQSNVPENRTILLVKDTSKYVWEVNHVIQWNTNLYNYQLITPSTLSYAQVQTMMQEDLKRYFGLNASMEKRRVKCWVLRAEDTSLIKSKGGNKVNEWELDNYRVTMKNITKEDLQWRFIYNFLQLSPYPFVDETNYTGNVDMTLEDIIFDNSETFIKALKKYKMTLSLEDHDINMLVISEPDYKIQNN